MLIFNLILWKHEHLQATNSFNDGHTAGSFSLRPIVLLLLEVIDAP